MRARVGPINCRADRADCRDFRLHVFVNSRNDDRFRLSFHILMVVHLGLRMGQMSGRFPVPKPAAKRTENRIPSNSQKKMGATLCFSVCGMERFFFAAFNPFGSETGHALCTSGPFGPPGPPTDPRSSRRRRNRDYFFLWLYGLLYYLPPLSLETPALLIRAGRSLIAFFSFCCNFFLEGRAKRGLAGAGPFAVEV